MKRDKMITKFFALLDEVEATQDAQSALKICQMFIDGTLATPKCITDGRLRYYPKSRKRVKCCKCNIYYNAGAPCFVLDGKGWHEECGSSEDKKFPYYLKCKDNETSTIAKVIPIKQEEQEPIWDRKARMAEEDAL